ncbi:MAG: tetratricopeptide repeat protein [Chthoniobacteraceae bacterium]
MPWDLVNIEQTRWYKKPIFWIAVAALACLLLLLLPRVQVRYRAWTERRGIQRAAQAYLRGDFKQAVVDARGVLKKNPHSPEATRIVAKSLEAMESPQALVWRRELDTLQSGDSENLLGMAAACIKTGDFDGASRALQKLKPEDQKTARFHDLAAKVARRNRDTASAETHWQEAVRLEPKNDEFRLGLASVQLESRAPETRAAALEALGKMAANPAQRIAALRVLVADSVVHSEKSRTRQLAAELAADPAAEFTDKVSCLAVLRTARDAKASAYLAELQALAASDSEKIYKLMSWMNENNLALVLLEWVNTLPPELTAQPPVCATVADAYARAADWNGLKAKIENANWGEMDYLRLAFLARALDRLNEENAAAAAWNNALALAQTRPDWLEVLGRVTKAWGWKQRAEDTLWKLSGTDRVPRWAAEFLWSAALARQDTPKLYEASKLLMKADPGNLVVRNHHIALALLTGQTADAPLQLAETHYQQTPQTLAVGVTYGLALFQQGRAAEAVAVMERYKPEELRRFPTSTYYAIFLAAAGQAERADEYFQIGAKGALLPEEKALVSFLAPACRARALDRGGEAVGSRAAWDEAMASAEAHPEWLEMLGRMALDWQWKPQAEALSLKLASLERCPPWAGDTLWTAALGSGNPGEIYRASRLISTAKPKDVAARNHFIVLSLLMRRELEATHKLAEALHQEAPRDPEVAVTYGLSLCQRDRADQAVSLIAGLTPEQQRQPRVALYHGIFLCAAGQPDAAAPQLAAAASAAQFPEEKALCALLQRVMLLHAPESKGNPGDASGEWRQIFSEAQTRPDWLAIVGRMALAWGWEERAVEALGKLTEDPTCPRWAIDALWAAAVKSGDSARLYQASRLLTKADPANVAARNRYLSLALLTGRDVDAAQRQIAIFARENAGNVEVAATSGLSLYQQGKADEAAALMKTFPPEKLRDPAVALYPGLFLAATGRREDAAPFLQIAANAPLLPEEKALLAKAQSGATAPAAAPRPATTTSASAPAAAVAPIDRTRRDTVQLFKEAREVMLADPKNVLARSNYILLALLTGQSADSARQLARALFKEQPKDAAAAACYGLSLVQQGKSDEAIAVMETLNHAQMREPLTALYYGYFLRGSQRTDQAARSAEFLQLAGKTSLLREEEAFLRPGK